MLHHFVNICIITLLQLLVVPQLVSQEMDLVTQIQILDKAVYIAHNANTLEKGMNLTILPPTIRK